MNTKLAFALLALVVSAFAVGRAFAAESPLSYSTFAFLTGDWSDGAGETIAAAPFLGEGSLKFEVTGISSTGEPFTEIWIAGFDPRGVLYLDVYSPGGWRTAMEGKMIVPARVWAFESSADPAGDVERRIFTKLGPEEFALKNEVIGPGGKSVLSIEKRFLRNSMVPVPSPDTG